MFVLTFPLTSWYYRVMEDTTKKSWFYRVYVGPCVVQGAAELLMKSGNVGYAEAGTYDVYGQVFAQTPEEAQDLVAKSFPSGFGVHAYDVRVR